LIDSREPQVLAGIVSDLRIINGQRGKVAISSSMTKRP
jgi:DNA polymerase III subunit alpha